MAAAMAARRLARDGQGRRRRGAQPRRGPIPGGSGRARASLLPSGTRGCCRGVARPPRDPPRAALPLGVTAWAPRRPAPAAAGGGARRGAERGGLGAEQRSKEPRSGRGLLRPPPRLPPLSPALPPPARPPLPSERLRAAIAAASCRLPPDDCQVLRKSASGESNLLLLGEL